MEMLEWAQRLQEKDYKRVALTKLPGDRSVSTVWLGLDHSMGGDRKLIFESMLFPECEECDRYETLEEALEGHERMVLAALTTPDVAPST